MPERMCVCCRTKGKKEGFFRIALQEETYVFDRRMKIQNRGFYVCRNIVCIEKLSKNKRYKVESSELLEMLKEIEKEKKNIIDIIRPMKNSDFFVFGVDENIEGIKKNKVKLLILPKDINEKYINQFTKLKEEYKTVVINIEEKKELSYIFLRDVNVVGIIDKKVVNGILTKLEVTE